MGDMGEMIFLHEFLGDNKTAQVFRRRAKNDFVVIGYINGLERLGHPFSSEQSAEDFAEDWVLQPE
jgi:hypothetical protein